MFQPETGVRQRKNVNPPLLTLLARSLSGFALSHENSVTDITCPEAVKLDDLDAATITSNFADAKKEFDSAEEGSEAKAGAQIDMEVNRAMAFALGTTIA